MVRLVLTGIVSASDGGGEMDNKTEADLNEAAKQEADAEQPTAKQFIKRLEAVNPPPINTYTLEEDGAHFKISIHPRASLRRQAMAWLASFRAEELDGEVFRLPKASWKNTEVAKTLDKLFGLSPN